MPAFQVEQWLIDTQSGLAQPPVGGAAVHDLLPKMMGAHR